MSKLKFLRQDVVAEQKVIFMFNRLAYQFLVKNFTEGAIYVNFIDEEDEVNDINKENSIKIPSETAQVLTANISKSNENRADKVLIIAEITGEVEVQLLEW